MDSMSLMYVLKISQTFQNVDNFASYYFSVFTFIIYTEKTHNTTSFGNIKKGCSPLKTNNYPLKMLGLKDIFSF